MFFINHISYYIDVFKSKLMFFFSHQHKKSKKNQKNTKIYTKKKKYNIPLVYHKEYSFSKYIF